MTVELLEVEMPPQDVSSDDQGALNIAALGAILWGGTRGEGLVHTVARLSQSVETLGNTVTQLSTRVIGDDGLTAQVRALTLELARTKADLLALLASAKEERTKEIAAAKVEADERHRSNQVKINAVLVLMAPLMGGFVWLIYRSIYIAVTGHLK